MVVVCSLCFLICFANCFGVIISVFAGAVRDVERKWRERLANRPVLYYHNAQIVPVGGIIFFNGKLTEPQ